MTYSSPHQNSDVLCFVWYILLFCLDLSFFIYTLFIQRSKAEEMQNLRLRVAMAWQRSFHSFWTPWPRPPWLSVAACSPVSPCFDTGYFLAHHIFWISCLLDSGQWGCCRGALLRAPCNDPSSRSHLSCDEGWGTGLNQNTSFLYYCRVWVSDTLWYKN